MYTILESPQVPSDNFSLNETTGQLFLISPLNYEDPMVMNASGLFKIVVQARDMGTPALSSNTTVTITVQVQHR